MVSNRVSNGIKSYVPLKNTIYPKRSLYHNKNKCTHKVMIILKYNDDIEEDFNVLYLEAKK